MAAISKSPIKPVQWTPAEVTYGAQDGRIAVRLWENLINYNNCELEKKPLEWTAAATVGLNIFGSLGRASDVFTPEWETGKVYDNFFANHEDAFTVGALALITFNAITVLRAQTNKKVSEVPSTMDKFLVVVWKATPYLMLITNVALIIIDLRNNKVIAMVSLAAVGISLIDLTSWKPKDFAWYLDVGVRVPLDIATMYYHENLRVPIIIGLALDPRIRATFTNAMRRWA